MRRYNYRLSERRWLEKWASDRSVSTAVYAAALLPERGRGLGLENARLVILADVFRRFAEQMNGPSSLAVYGAAPEMLQPARALGCLALELAPPEASFLVEARDFAHLSREVARDSTLSCGRLFGASDVELHEILPDVGADALRLALLFLGPPGRDLVFKHETVASAFRFVQRFWRLAQNTGEADMIGSPALDELEGLEERVKQRMGEGKPHTALAAIFGYINRLKEADRITVIRLARLLRSFAPFIASDILSDLGMPAGEYDHSRNRDDADTERYDLSQHKRPN